MPRTDNQFEADARKMAERIEKDRGLAQQLTFLPDEVEDQADAKGESGGQVGRPKGAKNKSTTQLRDWLAARGLRMPEDVLTEIAGLRSRDDAITLAMARAERIIDWSHGGKLGLGKDLEAKVVAGIMSQRLTVFSQQYTIILRALEAIMPYTAAKATPDVAVTQNTTVIVPLGPQAAHDPAEVARDVTPKRGRMMPANVAHEIEQKQQLSETESQNSDAEIRTDEANH